MKPFIPQIRIISVDHDRTITAEARLRHALDRHSMNNYPVRNVFCHLEAGRCGVKAGIVAVEVEGQIVWAGKELTDESADALCERLPAIVRHWQEEYGLL